MINTLSPYAGLSDWMPEEWWRNAQRQAALRETALDRRCVRLLSHLDAPPDAGRARGALAWLSALRESEMITAGVFADLVRYVGEEHAG